MEIIKKLYRKDFAGEDVSTVGLYIDAKWTYQKEFVPLSVEYQPVSNKAVVIGNGISRLDFNLRLCLPWRETTAWGEQTEWKPALNAVKKFNTYGCNALYRDYKVDFLVATGDEFLKEIATNEYSANNIVYASKSNLTKYPEKFMYIPQDPNWNAGAVAAYMAAFDGHKKVYMLGFDGIDNSTDIYNVYAGTPSYPAKTDTILEDFWMLSLANVMRTYSDTEFIRVAPSRSFRTPEDWKYFLNYRVINFRDFVLEADV